MIYFPHVSWYIFGTNLEYNVDISIPVFEAEGAYLKGFLLEGALFAGGFLFQGNTVFLIVKYAFRNSNIKIIFIFNIHMTFRSKLAAVLPLLQITNEYEFISYASQLFCFRL